MPLSIGLRTQSGHFLMAVNGGGGEVNAISTQPRPYEWETFGLYDPPRGNPINSGDQVTLQAHNGMYVSAVNQGGGAVIANAQHGFQWETFTILHADGSGGEITNGQQVAFKTYDGRHFLMAVNGGGGEVNAISTQPTPREWETFTIHILGGGRPFKAETGNIRLDTGEWMQASATFSNSGRLDRDVHIWTNIKLRGFRGGSLIVFYDSEQNIIANSRLIRYGVDGSMVGENDRRVHDVDQMGQDIYNKCSGMKILLAKHPKTIEDLINRGEYIGKKVSDLIKAFG